MAQADHWYQELILEFPDGAKEIIFLDISRSGRHRPRQDTPPAQWTKLDCHKCPCCALTLHQHCLAALSLEETLLRFNRRTSTEMVNATAIDSENRRTSVRWPLQEIGATFVQLAVFSSGCPVGDRFRPMLMDLKPFATTHELGKHLVGKHLAHDQGDAEVCAKAVVEELKPLREVFSHLFMRLQTIAREASNDAIPNSIVHMHAMTLHLGVTVKETIEQLLKEKR